MKEEIIDTIVEYAIVGAFALACFGVAKACQKIKDRKGHRRIYAK